MFWICKTYLVDYFSLEEFETKIFTKQRNESQNCRGPQNLIGPLFLKKFLRLPQYFHFFVSNAPNFLLTDSAEFRQCFTYAKHTSPTIFCWARWLWSESFRLKRSESQNFRHPQNPIGSLFLKAFLRLLQYFHFYVSYSPDFFTHG